jgi:chloramphenicol 3-O phosphotransferase
MQARAQRAQRERPIPASNISSMRVEPGTIVVLNGAPRSGKSSIVRAIQASSSEPWVNLGVDVWMAATPPKFLPGIGLRPGGERPDLEPFVVALFDGLYDAIAAQSRLGINVVVDVGHHDAYSRPLHILPMCAARLRGLPVLFVGVRCPLPVVLARRNASEGYVGGSVEDGAPDAVQRWQIEVHRHGSYDLEVDTSRQSPDECASVILERLASGTPGHGFRDLTRTVE